MTGGARRNDLSALAIGTLFGLGLAVSEMVNPYKVQGFLDVTGDWDPSLALVLAAGVAVTFLGFRWILRADAPLFHPEFHLPTRTDVDAPLLLGAALFGIGWGLGGYCPGPALAAISIGSWEPLVFLAAMVAGGLLQGRMTRPPLDGRAHASS